MRNFKNEEIQSLVYNGFLMPASEKYYLYPHPNRNNKQYLPVGYPVLMNKANFIQDVPGFPLEILKEHIFTEDTTHRYFKYNLLLPNGLQDLTDLNLNNLEILEKFKHWTKLAELFIVKDLSDDKEKEFEVQLLQTFRELFYLHLMDRKISFSPIDDLFFDLFDNGHTYRYTLKEYFNHIYNTFTDQSDIFNSVIVTLDDLVLLERSAINNTNTFHHSYFCHIRNSSLFLWNYVLNCKNLVGSYNIASPFYENFKKTLLKSKYNRRAIQDTTNLLEWLNLFDFSLLKDIYLELLQKSNKVALSNYVTKQLTLHNSLPQLSHNLVLNKSREIVYKDTFTFDFSLIKSHVNNHLYAGQCLLAIVEKAFEDTEKDCSRIAWQHLEKEDVIIFLIETLDSIKIDDLSRKLISCMNAVLSPEFLDETMIKLLCKHASNAYSRKQYENDTNVMSKYLNLKDKVVLKEKLDKKLVSKNTTEKVKKI